MRNHFTMIRSGLPALQVSLLTLLTVLPSWVNAAPFEKAYTESMIVADGTTMGEAKLALIDKIRLDALNDAGARLKNTKTLVQVGTRESDPTSVFSKTMVSLIHVESTNYTSNMNTNGQIELTAKSMVSVDDTELQKADDNERRIAQQQQHVKQLDSLILQQNRTIEQLRDKLLAIPLPKTVPVLPGALPDQKTQNYLPSVGEIVSQNRIIKDISSGNSARDPLKLTNEERNTDALTMEQQVRFDQLCERFKAIDKMILGNSGVQTTYLGGSVEQDNSVYYTIHYVIHVTWDWTAEMQAIRHLMGDAGTISNNTYIVNGLDINDKALLVAVRRCERADRFILTQDETTYIPPGLDDGPDEVHKIFSATENKSGRIYQLVFKGSGIIKSRKTIKADDKGLPDESDTATVPPAYVDDDWTKDKRYDPNASFGRAPDFNPEGDKIIRNEDEEPKTKQASARQAQADKPKPAPQHSRFVSFFGRVFAAGITGHTIDPAKCAEYVGVLVERPGQNGTPYFSCETRVEASRGNVISVIPPLPTPTQ